MKHRAHSPAPVRTALAGWPATVRLLCAALVLSAGLPSAGPAGAALGQDTEEAARAAARAVGAAGQADAKGVATDAAQALTVPGFAGTNVPQTGHTDANMEAAACSALADPHSEGGEVGAFVAASGATRPDADIEEDDPAIVRGEAVQDTPKASS